jgi:hypothetical protein
MAEPINPVLQDIRRQEVISDPNVRELYFGSPDYGGLISEARAASQQYLNQGPTMRPTAGLSPLEISAMQGAYGGIGGYKPYLQAQERTILDGMGMLGEQRNLIGEAIGATRRSGEMQQPYFAQAQQQYGAGLGDLMSSFGQQGPSARDYQRASLQGFDPRSSAAYYNPFEQQVVQQTIQDVMKGGAQQDIAARARDIQSGGESAFGSRARLSAGERQASLGRGLGEALSQIRSGGFDTAQSRAMEESRFGRGALERAGQTEAGYGQALSGARRGYAGDMLSLGQQRGDLARGIGSSLAGYGQDIGGIGSSMAGYGSQLGGLGESYQQMGMREREELMNLGGTARDLKDTQLGREYDYSEALRSDPMRALSYVQGFAPQYQSGQTQVNKTYGMPVDPLSQGLGAALSAYQALKPPMQYQQPQYDPSQQNQPTQTSAYDSYMNRTGVSNNTGNTDFYGQNFINPSNTPYQPLNPSTQAGQNQIIGGGQFAGQMGPQNQISVPSSIPPPSYNFNIPPAFNPSNPGANLPYNPFGPRK